MPTKKKSVDPQIDKRIKRRLYVVPILSMDGVRFEKPHPFEVWAQSPEEAKQKAVFQFMAGASEYGEPLTINGGAK